ncbi:MAG: NRDE family protein [Flavobacteriales bacterium]|nr:NRDE family protein [Flavobacteriales bacterium]
MCLCLFAINEHDEFPLILIANRDEFRKRPAAKADFWEDEPTVLAGRDLEGMGTWLGTNTAGKIAFLTNYRHPDFFGRKGPTRGKLVSNFLTSDVRGDGYLKAIENPEAYNGFNLVVGTAKELFFFSNVENRIKTITSGIHGLSNAFLDTSWPKVDDGKAKLKAALAENALDTASLFSILSDSSIAKEEELPNTGVGLEFEKVLSAKFINTPDYGTVCSTVIKVDRNGTCFFNEKTFNNSGRQTKLVNYQFKFVPIFKSK